MDNPSVDFVEIIRTSRNKECLWKQSPQGHFRVSVFSIIGAV